MVLLRPPLGRRCNRIPAGGVNWGKTAFCAGYSANNGPSGGAILSDYGWQFAMVL
jgi:hypothetical protein